MGGKRISIGPLIEFSGGLVQVFGAGLLGSTVDYIHYDYVSATYPMDLGPSESTILVLAICISAFVWAIWYFLDNNRKRNVALVLDEWNGRGTRPS